jgi:hypothetical protein
MVNGRNGTRPDEAMAFEEEGTGTNLYGYGVSRELSVL